MAIRTISDAGGNWNSTGTWTEGAVPTSSDDVVATATSGNLTINTTAACRSMDLTNYTGTVTHNSGIYLTIGSTDAKGDNVALKLAGTYTAAATSGINFNSSSGNTLTIDWNSSSFAYVNFDGGNYQFLSGLSNISIDYGVTISSGTVDTNDFDFTISYLTFSGASAKTMDPGSSYITLTGTTSYAINYTGSNMSFAANTGTIKLSNTGGMSGNGIDYNGLTLIVGSTGTGTNYLLGGNTFGNLIIESVTSKTINLSGSTTTTVTGNIWCFGSNGTITFTHYGGGNFTLSKSSGTVDFYNTTINYGTLSGGATWNLHNACAAGTDTIGHTLLGGNWYIDPVNGNDATTMSPYGWWMVSYTGATGTAPVLDEVASGVSSSSSANIMGMIDLYEWSLGSGTLYFYGKSGTFTSEQVNLGTGGGHFDITSDLTYCPWLTSTNVSTRLKVGGTIALLKSPDPESIGSATWTTRTTGSYTKEQYSVGITSSTNASPIVLTLSSMPYSNGDYIIVAGHATNTNANGIWKVANISGNTLELEGSTGNGTGISTGYVHFEDFKIVRLGTAVTKLVSQATESFTTANGSTVGTLSYTTDSRGCGTCAFITLPASTSSSTKYGYYTLPSSLDLSAYDGLTFWFRSLIALGSDDLVRICFCSDTTGDTIVDSFSLTKTSTTRWIPYTIMKSGGGTLGASIQSIAVYTGPTATLNSYTFRMQNFSAITDGGLNLNSLISKSSSAVFDAEWFPILNIQDTYIQIDNATDVSLFNMQGYYGTTETVTTYKRDALTALPATATNTCYLQFSLAGVEGIPNYLSGGWSSSNGTKDGSSFISYRNSYGYGVYITSNWWTITDLYSVRCYDGLRSQSPGTYLLNYGATGCAEYGLYFSQSPSSLDGLYCSNNDTGVYAYQRENTFNNLIANNNESSGISVYYSHLTRVYNGCLSNNGNEGVRLTQSSSCLFKNVEICANDTGVYTLNGILNKLSNCVITNNGQNGQSGDSCQQYISAQDLNEVEGNYYVWFTPYTYMYNTSVAGERHTESGIGWKLYFGNAARLESWPIEIFAVKVAVNSGTDVTAKIWVKKGTASSCGVKWVCLGNQACSGATDVSDTKTDDTNWEQLSVTVTPTRQGVLEFKLYGYYVSASDYIYFDDFSVE